MSKLKSLTDEQIEKLSFTAVRLIVIAGFCLVFLCIGGSVWLMWVITKVVTQ